VTGDGSQDTKMSTYCIHLVDGDKEQFSKKDHYSWTYHPIIGINKNYKAIENKSFKTLR
jgi:hypothetical protein